jgi:hypothetical protein
VREEGEHDDNGTNGSTRENSQLGELRLFSLVNMRSDLSCGSSHADPACPSTPVNRGSFRAGVGGMNGEAGARVALVALRACNV